MRTLDRLLQRWRIAVASPWVREGDRLLDVGCFDRSLLERVSDRVTEAVGVDPLAEPYRAERLRVLRGEFPGDFESHADFGPESFDSLTMLAVFEHATDPAALAGACHRLLRSGGRAILTVPHPVVDPILDALMFMRLADGMSTEEHHGFDVRETAPIFEAAGFRVRAARSFQLGLNRLFVFEKP